MATVLIIDDNHSVAIALDVLLSLHDIQSISAETPDQGLAQLERHEVDLVIQDMNFGADTTSGMEGVDLFHRIRESHPGLPVILLTAWTHLDIAVDLVKAGAADYLSKPWDDQRLITTVKNLLDLGQARTALQRKSQRELAHHRELEGQFDLRGMVWRDGATERVLQVACQVARADVPVLITGPNGTGKEKLAEIIQANSSVSGGPFVTLNCGAIPSELIEAELFGAEAGAYTGAGKARAGKFEAADGGTLFLDEIGNLPLPGQMKLLRILESGRFQRLGSNQERQVRVRVISATNANLDGMIKSGQFREDLLYRLNVIELELPALASRPDDILPLARHFLGNEKNLHVSACEALLRHSWPGNVRELKNVMQRASLLCKGNDITAIDLRLPATPPLRLNPESEPDKASIERALERAGGVVAQAASELGLSRQALYRRMERLGISRIGSQ
jgi:DNA-binding NtrC family response regulator